MKTSNKIEKMFKIFKMLYEGEQLFATSENQQDMLGLSLRSYNRYLDEIESDFEEYMPIIKTNENRNGKNVKVYKKLSVNHALENFLEYMFREDDDGAIILFEAIKKYRPNALQNFDDNDKEEIIKFIKKDQDVFLFRSNPYEAIMDIGNFFSILKNAVRECSYLDIEYKHRDKSMFKGSKPLKLIFSENNWYLAVEYGEKNKFKLLRAKFILNAKKSEDKKSFSKKSVLKYEDYFNSKMQNSMTLYGAEEETAVLRASRKIVSYFRDDMKAFFKSQEYKYEDEEKRVIFEVKYTQHIEILPFIKKWLPDIEIISPKSLKNAFKKDLNRALQKLD